MTQGRIQPSINVRPMVSRVPEVTVYFWIIKVLTTGMGEVTSDFLASRFDPVIAGGAAGLVFIAALVLQFRARRYIAWIYWLAVVMVSVVGTMGADFLHIIVGVPYAVSTVFFAIVLAAIFLAWFRVEKTLDIHSIRTRRREVFYWLTVLATFAFGTAAGDLSAALGNLGYLGAGMLFLVVIVIPAIGHRMFGMGAILAFWFAYVVTRPLGASFADWLAVPSERGGLGLGLGPVSLTLTILIVAFVGFMAFTRRDAEPEPDMEVTAPIRPQGAE
jgi:uncharacterized membrane-anchored protein